MKRPLSIVLANAFERAAFDVAHAPEVHGHTGDDSPTRWENWVYWSRGLVAGLLADVNSVPHKERVQRAIKQLPGILSRELFMLKVTVRGAIGSKLSAKKSSVHAAEEAMRENRQQR